MMQYAQDQGVTTRGSVFHTTALRWYGVPPYCGGITPYHRSMSLNRFRGSPRDAMHAIIGGLLCPPFMLGARSLTCIKEEA